MFRKFSLLQIVLFIFGIFALWSGISYLRDNMDLAENGEVVEALITHIEVFEYRNDDNELERDYEVYLEYEYMGETINTVSRSMYPGLEEGKIIEVYIDPEDPTDPEYKETAYLFPAMFIVVGLGIIGVAFFMGTGSYGGGRRRNRTASS